MERPTGLLPDGSPIGEEVAERIHRRRRQILGHSILYYRLDATLITDAEYDAWARELARLQADHPQVARSVLYHRAAFADFDGTTGYHLPLEDPQAVLTARRLPDYSRTTPTRHAAPAAAPAASPPPALEDLPKAAR